MIFLLQRTLFRVIFNFTLFLILMIGIQNSSNKKRVNLLINETVNLPVSFIMGISFISGSLIGSFVTFNPKD